MMPTKHQQTYVITGAAGFIGSYLCSALLNDPLTKSIVAIDSVNEYYSQKIKNRRITILSQNNKFHFEKISVLDSQILRSIISSHNPTVLIHAAAQVGVRNGELHPAEYISTNVLGTLNLLQCMPASLQHAIVFSSSSVYGSVTRVPFRETEKITIETPLSLYGVSKAAMEMAVRTLGKSLNFPITIIRPFSIYGPDGRPDMLPMKLLIAAKKNIPLTVYAPQDTARDWTYIDDCVAMILASIGKPNGIQTINIGTGHPIVLENIIEISQKIISQFGYTIKLLHKAANPIELTTTCASTTKLKKILTPLPFTRYADGFQKTAEFFFSHSDLYN